jgi:PTS system N-acetylglucosamine-specific IIC component
LSTKGWEAIPIGIIYFVVYYGLFRFFIKKFDLATPGRETEAEIAADGPSPVYGGNQSAPVTAANTRAAKYIAALGGAGNLTVIDACTTRLRLNVVDSEVVSEPALKAAGARALLRQGKTTVQVIIGPEADLIADEIRQAVDAGVGREAAPVAAAVKPADAGPLDPDPVRWIAVFGGAGNVAALDAVATTRLRVVVRDPSAVDRSRLDTLDVAWVSPDTFHIVCGNAAQRYAQVLGARLPSGGAAPQPA